MPFQECGCSKNAHIPAATHPKILNVVPNLFLDMEILPDGRICRLSHFHITIINENIRNKRIKRRKIKGSPISKALTCMKIYLYKQK